MTPQLEDVAADAEPTPFALPRRARLVDGTEILIRLLRPDDRAAFTGLYDRLGEHSKYQRFFACPARLPASWADALLDLSPERRVGVVAEPVGEPGRIIAVADYTISVDARSAEVGLLVEDAWQHRGLGRVVFDDLLTVGERHGVSSFVAYVHSSNLRVLHTLGHAVRIVNRSAEAGVLKFTFTRR